MKVINANVHAALDYLTVIVLALSPTLFPLSATAATLTYALAVAQLLLSLLTAYGPSLTKVVPFRQHGNLELGLAIVLLALVWLLPATVPADRYYYSAYLVVVVVVRLLTDFSSGLR